MPTQYIEDPETKQRIPFEWDKAEPPTSQDIESLFQAVRSSAAPQPQSSNAILHGAATTASGVNKGISGMAGMPVDILNAALSMVGLGSNNPVMGSKWISNTIMPQEVKPEGVVETTLNALGEQVPYFLPGVGTATNIPRAAWQAGKVALGSGIGSGMARTFAPDSPYMDMAAQLAGGLTPAGIKAGVSILPKSFELSMMERAVKPSTVLKAEEAQRRLNTALDEGITATKSGLEKSKQTIKDINSEIQGRIDQLSNQGARVNQDNVLAPALDMARAEIPKMAYPEGPTKQIVNALEGFAGTPKNSAQVTLRQAQDYKQAINKELDEFYAALNASPDKLTALSSQWTYRTKAKIADGLRAEISDVFPEVKELNKREAALIQLNKSLERAVNRISHHDLLSLRGMVGLVVHPKYAVMNYVLNNPAVQSNLAVAIRKARTSPANFPGIAGEAVKQASDRLNNNQYQTKFTADEIDVEDLTRMSSGGW